MKKKGFVGWKYVVGVVLALFLLLILLFIFGKSRTFMFEQLEFIKEILGIT
jgi:hypothetical protein